MGDWDEVYIIRSGINNLAHYWTGRKWNTALNRSKWYPNKAKAEKAADKLTPALAQVVSVQLIEMA